ncbi:hypothetical protein [Aurantibacter aestuarii]|uniref:Lipoprotein n=1 Tax=Aurantibacter aestuarii TaxID=1266046 RepID=A0A2T1N5L0_9FLAO|nr:hypothetical protein [Aurantibacter aestuarii]PSG86555.1 hypothetical protein C7H52_12800 [Aurantibacter aestuarii]
MNKAIFQILFCTVLIVSCKETNSKRTEQKTKKTQSESHAFRMPEFKPFIIEFDWYNSTGEERIFRLTNDSLFVYNPKKSSEPVFKTDKLPADSIKKIEKINIYELKTDYTSPGIRDGVQIRLNFTKQENTRKIQLRNYYQKELSPIIEMINEIVPTDHKFWYDKEWLMKYTPKE